MNYKGTAKQRNIDNQCKRMQSDGDADHDALIKITPAGGEEATRAGMLLHLETFWGSGYLLLVKARLMLSSTNMHKLDSVITTIHSEKVLLSHQMVMNSCYRTKREVDVQRITISE